MYQLIIHYDDGRVAMATQGTYSEIVAAMPGVAASIDPDEAVWELIWRHADAVISQELLENQFGRVKNGNHSIGVLA